METSHSYFIRVSSSQQITGEMIRNIQFKLTKEEYEKCSDMFDMHIIINDSIKKHYGQVASTLREVVENGKSKLY